MPRSWQLLRLLVGSWMSWIGLATVALPLPAQLTLMTALRLAINGIDSGRDDGSRGGAG